MMGPQQIDVWTLKWRHLSGRAATELEDLLTPEEKTRMNRFHKPDDRQRFGLARGALRSLSARYLDADPHALILERGPHDKPFWSNGEPLRFNLSHSGEWVLLAFSNGLELGIDIQETSSGKDILGIAETALHPDEKTHLAQISDPAQQKRVFYDLWALREAALKASGDGLSGNRRNFSALPLPHPRGWTRRNYLRDGVQIPLQFHDCGRFEGHASALAVVTENPRDLRVSIRDVADAPA